MLFFWQGVHKNGSPTFYNEPYLSLIWLAINSVVSSLYNYFTMTVKAQVVEKRKPKSRHFLLVQKLSY